MHRVKLGDGAPRSGRSGRRINLGVNRSFFPLSQLLFLRTLFSSDQSACVFHHAISCRASTPVATTGRGRWAAIIQSILLFVRDFLPTVISDPLFASDDTASTTSNTAEDAALSRALRCLRGVVGNTKTALQRHLTSNVASCLVSSLIQPSNANSAPHPTFNRPLNALPSHCFAEDRAHRPNGIEDGGENSVALCKAVSKVCSNLLACVYFGVFGAVLCPERVWIAFAQLLRRCLVDNLLHVAGDFATAHTVASAKYTGCAANARTTCGSAKKCARSAPSHSRNCADASCRYQRRPNTSH